MVHKSLPIPGKKTLDEISVMEPKLFALAEPEPECIPVLVPEPDLYPPIRIQKIKDQK
jgi:hypothetical protein